MCSSGGNREQALTALVTGADGAGEWCVCVCQEYAQSPPRRICAVERRFLVLYWPEARVKEQEQDPKQERCMISTDASRGC